MEGKNAQVCLYTYAPSQIAKSLAGKEKTVPCTRHRPKCVTLLFTQWWKSVFAYFVHSGSSLSPSPVDFSSTTWYDHVAYLVFSSNWCYFLSFSCVLAFSQGQGYFLFLIAHSSCNNKSIELHSAGIAISGKMSSTVHSC